MLYLEQSTIGVEVSVFCMYTVKLPIAEDRLLVFYDTAAED
ncbi:MAG: hypothetical protein WCA84_13860 [Ignavibacteriaceae bacterium]|jgi:hypothetical protein